MGQKRVVGIEGGNGNGRKPYDKRQAIQGVDGSISEVPSMTLLYHEVPVAVFTPEVRRAITRVALRDPWTELGGKEEGTAAVLSQSVLEAGIPLPPIAMYPLYRAGICLSGYSSRLAPLFKEIRDLTWWGWPVSGKAFFCRRLVVSATPGRSHHSGSNLSAL